MYQYKCVLDRVVDGDTVDVHIDLGFDVWLRHQRVRLSGIDCPEVRTRDDVEKIFGNAAMDRVVEVLSAETIVLDSQAFEGKFGRILGDFYVAGDSRSLTEILLEERHAVLYDLPDEEKQQAVLENRRILVETGKVIVQ